MKVTTKQISGGWMVYIDGRNYLKTPTTLHTAEIIAQNARIDIKNGVALNFN